MNKIIIADNKDIEYNDFKLTKIGLEAIGKPTYDQWKNCGKFIKKAEQSVQFWLGDWINYGEKVYGKKYNQAIKATDYEQGTLHNASYVARQVEISRRSEVLSYSHHKEVAPLKPKLQDELLNKAEKEKLSTRELRKEVKKAKHKDKIQKPLPKGKYDVIYADPPWRYQFSETNTREIENQYPTMKLDEIRDLKIPSADNSILLLWATAPKIEEAISVLNAWGFTYKTCAVWDKEIIGMGYWFRGQHELLLIGIKGNFPTPIESVRASSVYKERRTKHSKKPNYYYQLIEDYFPGGKYLELFARKKFNKKWTVWGNEAT